MPNLFEEAKKIKMEYELYHHGILGMKWGVRRYQNKDGTRTAAGKERYRDKSPKTDRNKTKAPEEHPKPKSFKDYSDDELKAAIDRLALEKRYVDLVKSMRPEKKKNLVLSTMSSILVRSVSDVGTKTLSYALGKAVNKATKRDIIQFNANNKNDKGDKDKGDKDK